jgi:hypothetical protein
MCQGFFIEVLFIWSIAIVVAVFDLYMLWTTLGKSQKLEQIFNPRNEFIPNT